MSKAWSPFASRAVRLEGQYFAADSSVFGIRASHYQLFGSVDGVASRSLFDFTSVAVLGEWRWGRGWYAGSVLDAFTFIKPSAYSNSELYLGHRGMVKGAEFYLEGGAFANALFERNLNTVIGFRGLVGIVFPFRWHGLWRPGISMQPAIVRFTDGGQEMLYRTIDRLTWTASLAYFPADQFSIGAYWQHISRYSQITPTAQQDVYSYEVGVSCRYFYDRHSIRTKILKFY